MKKLNEIVKDVKYFFADKRGIAVGNRYSLQQLSGYDRMVGKEALRVLFYEEHGRKYRVKALKVVGEYYVVSQITEMKEVEMLELLCQK